MSALATSHEPRATNRQSRTAPTHRAPTLHSNTPQQRGAARSTAAAAVCAMNATQQKVERFVRWHHDSPSGVQAVNCLAV
ncbi:unnamed protein product [Colias eurytheme]|nr:unnamed protein product [Colias eurytheme]